MNTPQPTSTRGRKRLVRTGLIAAAAATLLLGTAISSANGAVPTTVAPPAPPVAGTPTGGWLTLETGAVNRVAYFPVAGPAAATQPLTAGASCQQLATDSSLLGFGGWVGNPSSPSAVALKYGSIGVVGTATGTSKSCAQVNALTEKLDLTINLDGPVASAAFLDIEVKGSSRIVATPKLGGVPVGPQFQLLTGSAVAGDGIPSSCRTNDDYGNDDHETGNCRWAISTPTWLGPDDGQYFDSLTLEATKGAFSLEGGADWGRPGVTLPVGLPPKASFFELAADVIKCGETTDQVGGGNDAPVILTRLETNADDSPCLPVAFSLTSEGSEVHFVKPLDFQIPAQYIFNVTWTKAGNLVQQTLPTTVDWESGLGDIAIPQCLLPEVTGGVLTGLQTPPGPGDDQDPAAGIQYACIGAATYTSNGPGSWTAVEQIYLTGDAYMRG